MWCGLKKTYVCLTDGELKHIDMSKGKTQTQMKEQVIVRACRQEDIEAATDVYLFTLDDLKRRHGVEPTPTDRAMWHRGYEHIFASGIFNVAELDGKVVAVCNGILRDKLWFLSGFWVLPDYQGMGIGHRLIDKTWQDAKAAGASEYFVWASVDLPAVGNYMRLGMLPGYQIFTLTAPSSVVKEKLAQIDKNGIAEGYRVDVLTAHLAGDIDQRVRGTRREVDHAEWLSDTARSGKAIYYGSSMVGYFYTRKGVIGPAAYLDERHEETVLELAFHQAVEEAESILVYIPGINRSALTYALQLGGRLVSHSHFLTTREFGEMTCYLPSGPLLY